MGKDMANMFFRATAFSQSIGEWSTGSVTVMRGMFDGAAAFETKYTAEWDTSKINDDTAFRHLQPCPDLGYTYNHPPSVLPKYGTAIERCGDCTHYYRAVNGVCRSIDFFKPDSFEILQQAVDEWCSSNTNQKSATAILTDISEWDTSAVTSMMGL